MYPGWGFHSGAIFFVAASVMLVSVIPLLSIPEGGVNYGVRVGKMPGHGGDAVDAHGAEQAAAEGAVYDGNFKAFLLFLVSIFLINSGINSMAVFRSQFLDLAGGFNATPGTISAVVNVEAVTLIAFGFLIGYLGRRFGLPALLTLGAVSGILSLSLYVAAPSIGFIYLASFFKGISDASIASSSYAFASVLIPPGKRGRYFAIYNSTFFLSWGLSATLLTGPLIDHLMKAGMGEVFSYKAGLLSGVALMVLGLILLLVFFGGTMRKPKPV